MTYTFVDESIEQGGQVDQTTFECVEAAQTTEQQAQVHYDVPQLPQSQLPLSQHLQPRKEKKVFQCGVCEKIFSHSGALIIVHIFLL